MQEFGYMKCKIDGFSRGMMLMLIGKRDFRDSVSVKKGYIVAC